MGGFNIFTNPDFNIFNIITLIGGLALFLFGMNVMGDGLEKGAGNRLKSILENLTSSQFRGLLLGLGVTAIIQSSSATTVMVVGFINSGIMKLSQSIGIIMGANIGTTVTAWLLSTTDIQGGTLILDLLKPSTFAPILALIGIILHMTTKDQKKHSVGDILLGFAVLIAGMEMMSGAVKPLAEMDSFRNILLLFTNPILGVLMGTLLTAIIQSSSASVGILQAMAITGAITYSNAVPIILGMNIGTCVTAVLSAIGTNRNARRAAMVHLAFNVINTVLILIIYYVITGIFNMDAFTAQAVSAFNIAVIHTAFKIVGTALLFPFGKQLEKLAYLIIPEKGGEEQPHILDERLLTTPTVAIAQAKKITNEVAALAFESITSAISLMDDYNPETVELIKNAEAKVDNYEDKLGTYLVKLSRESLNVEDSHEVTNLLHTIGDFERMTDHAVNILEVAQEINEKSIAFSEDALKEIKTMTSALTEIIAMTTKAFTTGDIELAKHIEPLEQVIDSLKKKMKSRHVKRLQQGLCTIETGFVFSDLITNCERIADHCSNIAVCLIQVANDSFETHEYLNHVKADGENDFVSQYENFKAKYRI